MFRTWNQRGKARFKTLWDFSGTKNGKLHLSSQQLKLIENSEAINLGEKIELLLVSLGNKLTTEIFMKVKYEYDSNLQKDFPSLVDLESIEQLLKKLPFVYFKDTLTRKNKNTDHNEDFVWFQVSVNETVMKFMKDFPDDLTEFEEGVLYGFPLSAIQACSELIEARYDHPNPATFYLAGICSKDFWEDEQSYYQLWWERLRKLSPKIVEEAERKFSERKK